MDSPQAIGRYLIRQTLGSGAMGKVYLAVDPLLDRQVAIKTVRTDLVHADDTDQFAQRFRREAQISAKLRHNGIVAIHDFGIEDGLAYLVMEYVRGRELQTLFNQRQRFAPAEVLHLMDELLAALGHAHRNGVVHRDVKPANIFLTEEGQLKLADFGIARVDRTSVTMPGTMLGTPSHMAPEQVRGEPATARSDLYSAGVVLYQLLTGEKPFTGELVSVLHKVLTEAPTPPSSLAPGLPTALDGVVARALAKDPEARFADADAFAQAMHAALPGVVALAPSPGSGETIQEYDPFIDARLRRETPSDPVGATQLRPPPAPARPAPAAAAGSRPPPAAPVDGAPPQPAARPRRRLPSFWLALLAVLVVVLVGLFALIRVDSAPPSIGPVVRPEGPAISAAAGHPLASNFVAWALGATGVLVLLLVVGRRLRDRLSALDGSLSFSGEALAGRLRSKGPAGADATVIARPGRDDADADRSAGAGRADAVAPVSMVAAEDRTQILPALAERLLAPAAQWATELVVLSCFDGALVGRRLPLSGKTFRIGRNSGLELSIPGDPELSRDHGVIEQTGGRFAVRDCGSVNGIYVNGRKVTGDSAQLLVNDEIQLSSRTTLRLVAASFRQLPDQTGQRVAERYRLLEQVHVSENAATYRGQDEQLQRAVMVKLFSPMLAAFPDHEARFRREATIAASLAHPHIVHILDQGTTSCGAGGERFDGVRYLCTEWMEGGSLARRLDAQVEPARLRDWIFQLADALEFAHARDIVHAGIKPSAVQFDGAGNVYLTDFAIAVHQGDASSAGFAGAPLLLAPEQWAGREATPATDQFALAVLNYRMVAGEWPFAGQKDRETRERNAKRGAIPAHEVAHERGWREVPAAVSPVLARAMSTDPAARYPSVRAFADEFANALLARRTSAPRVFLSYARQQSQGWPSFIAAQLETLHGVETFLDIRKLDAVERFPGALRREIELCDVFLCLLGADTLDSAWVREEIRSASRLGKPMVPIFQEGFQIARHQEDPDPAVQDLLQHQGVDLLDERQLYLKECVAELARRIMARTLQAADRGKGGGAH